MLDSSLFTVPKTVENFRALCTGEKGFGFKVRDWIAMSLVLVARSTGEGMTHSLCLFLIYLQGSSFHRVIPGFMCKSLATAIWMIMCGIAGALANLVTFVCP